MAPRILPVGFFEAEPAGGDAEGLRLLAAGGTAEAAGGEALGLRFPGGASVAGGEGLALATGLPGFSPSKDFKCRNATCSNM